MSLLYVNENGALIGIEGNKCVAKYKDGMKTFIPIESLEGITIMGQSQVTTKCMEECMMRGTCDLFLKRRQIFWAFNVHGPCEC